MLTFLGFITSSTTNKRTIQIALVQQKFQS